MTTLVLALDPETKRFVREDGPCVVHAGETVKLVLQGLGVHAETANANPADESLADPTALNYPALRARVVHPVYGDVAMYPFPGSSPMWKDEPDGSISCELSLDVEQLFAVVRSGRADALRLFVDRPWPQDLPAVYGEYGLRVDDWPEVTGETRVWPSEGRYVSALGAVQSLSALVPGESTLRETQKVLNAVLAALKNLAQR